MKSVKSANAEVRLPSLPNEERAAIDRLWKLALEPPPPEAPPPWRRRAWRGLLLGLRWFGESFDLVRNIGPGIQPLDRQFWVRPELHEFGKYERPRSGLGL